jgi:hypothetical protein
MDESARGAIEDIQAAASGPSLVPR